MKTLFLLSFLLSSCEGLVPTVSIQTDPVTGKLIGSASATYNYVPRPPKTAK